MRGFFEFYNMNKILFILMIFLSGCSKSENWVCKEDFNELGQKIQFSENIETGEIGPYSKCKN